MSLRSAIEVAAPPRAACEAMPLYLRVGDVDVFAVHHPAAAEARDLAVLVCPPYGWEEVSSHRVLREWARRLSDSGVASLRWSLPGFGDSTGSAGDPDLFDRWLNATDVAARWLRDAAGVSSVVALGLGLGGLLAYHTAATGTPLDGLVLWGVPARGRDLVRQTRAFSRLESSEFFNDLEPMPPPDDVAMEAGGFMFTQPTLDRLGAVDLSELTVPAAPLGALILERDGVAVDGRLVDALRAGSVQVSTDVGDGYAAMASHPQQAEVPEAVVATLGRWLSARARAGAHPRATLPEPASTTCEPSPAQPVTESPFELQTEEGRLAGVLAVPARDPAPVCAVFLNPGAQRRIGPNRMWVEAARRWAPRGVASLRLDMLGIGESDGPTTPYRRDGSLYRKEMVPRVLAALDELQRRGVADRFILVGLCAGAYWALDGALADERITSIMMLNAVAIVWDEEVGATRDLHRVFSERSWRLIRKNATPRRLIAVARMLAGLPWRALQRLRAVVGGPPTLEEEIDEKLQRLRASGTRVLAMFASREGLALDLRRSGRMSMLESWPGIVIRPIPVNDHTIRPIAVQRLVHRELDEELDRVLENVGGAEA